MIDLGRRGSRGAVLGPDPARERRADGDGAAAAAGPEGRSAPVATVLTDARGFWTRRLPVQRRAKYRFSWEEAGVDRGGRADAQRLSGVVDLATDTGAAVARRRDVSEFRDFYTAGYSLADPAEAERMGAGGRWGRARRPSTSSRCAPAPACGPGRWWRSAAGTGRCWPSSARAGWRRCSTASSSPRPRPRSRASAAVPGARRIEAFDGEEVPGRGRRLRPRGALARARARPGADVAAARGRAGGAGGAGRGAARGQPLRRRDGEARRGRADRPHPVLRPRGGARAGRASPGSAWRPSSPTPSPTPTTRSSPRRAAGSAVAAAKAGVRRAAWGAAPRAAEKLFTVHYACLARR